MRSEVSLALVIGMLVLLLGGFAFLRSATAPSPDTSSSPQPASLDSLPENAMLDTADIDPMDTDVRVTLKTSQGDIVLMLHGAAAPITVGNFVKLATENFYDGTTFHRVIPDFMIQGGDSLSKDPTQRAQHGTGGPGYQFGDEINDRPMVRGAVAMANAGPGTNGSQFFIVTGEAFPHLQDKHTNFGEVVGGMEIVDAISKVAADGNDNPLTPVVIQDVVVEQGQ